jgi:hypothetical protein
LAILYNVKVMYHMQTKNKLIRNHYIFLPSATSDIHEFMILTSRVLKIFILSCLRVILSGQPRIG